MLLTKQQRYVLDVLERLGCARKDQLAALVGTRFCSRNPQAAQRLTEAMLRQLCYGNCALRVEGSLVRLPRIRADPRRLEAIDVMLELSNAAPLDFDGRQAPPALLRFAVQGKKISLFAVLSAEAPVDRPCRRLTLQPTERVVFLLGGQTPDSLPDIPNKCFYAAAQADGSHRFFEAANQPKI